MLYIRFEIGKKYVSSKRKMIFGEKSSSSGIVMICVAGGAPYLVLCPVGGCLYMWISFVDHCMRLCVNICIFDYFTHFHAGTNVNKPLIYFIPRDDETANRNA